MAFYSSVLYINSKSPHLRCCRDANVTSMRHLLTRLTAAEMVSQHVLMHSLEYCVRTPTKISERCNTNPRPFSQMCDKRWITGKWRKRGTLTYNNVESRTQNNHTLSALHCMYAYRTVIYTKHWSIQIKFIASCRHIYNLHNFTELLKF